MQREREISVVVSDIGQTLADGGLKYFREFRGRYDRSNPTTMTIVYDAFRPLPHVHTGFGRLADAYHLGGYYTVRPTELMDQATGWLNRYSFPDSGNIHVCRDHEDKVRQVLRDILAPDPRVRAILIDDNAEGLVKAATKIVEETTEVIAQTQRLAVVEFAQGRSNNRPTQGKIHQETGIRQFYLTSWEEQEITSLIELLGKSGF